MHPNTVCITLPVEPLSLSLVFLSPSSRLWSERSPTKNTPDPMPFCRASAPAVRLVARAAASKKSNRASAAGGASSQATSLSAKQPAGRSLGQVSKQASSRLKDWREQKCAAGAQLPSSDENRCSSRRRRVSGKGHQEQKSSAVK